MNVFVTVALAGLHTSRTTAPLANLYICPAGKTQTTTGRVAAANGILPQCPTVARAR